MYELEGLTTLDDQQKSAIRRADLIDASEILLSSTSDLQKKLKLPDMSQTNAFIKAVSLAVAPKSSLVSELVERDEARWIRTGDEEIDRLLGGGIRRGVITEVVGESAAGKSHLALHLSLTSQLPQFTPLPGSTILLTSERKISFTRLQELATHTLSLAQSLPSSSAAFHSMPSEGKEMLDNVHTTHVTEVEGLDHALGYIIPAIISKLAVASSVVRNDGHGPGQKQAKSLPVRLLVIDSIGALFRASFDSNMSGLTQRSKMLCLISDKLKALAEEHDIAVLVINQVTDVFSTPSSSRYPPPSGIAHDEHPQGATMTYKTQAQFFSGQSPSLSKEASLGLVWANAVNVRMMLSRTGRRRALDHLDLARKRRKVSTYEKEVRAEEVAAGLRPEVEEEEQWESTLIRRMHLVFSPFAREDTLDYVITSAGLQGIPPTSRKKRPVAAMGDGDGDVDEFGPDLLDDLGELPAEFWNGEAFQEEREKAMERAVMGKKEINGALEREREILEAVMQENGDDVAENDALLEELLPEENEGDDGQVAHGV